MKLRNLTILLLLLKLGNIYPVIISLSLLEGRAPQKEIAGARESVGSKKRILIIGAAHYSTLQSVGIKNAQAHKDEMAEFAIIINWIKKIDSSVSFLLEGNNDRMLKFKNVANKQPLGCCELLPVLASDHNFKYNNIKFSLIDERTEKSLCVFYIFSEMFSQEIKGDLSIEQTNKLKQIITQKWGRTHQGAVTIAIWLNEIKLLKIKLTEKFEQLKNTISPTGLMLLNDEFKILEQSIVSVEQLLTKYDQNQPVTDVIVDLWLSNRDNIEQDPFYEKQYNITVSISDIGFLLHLEENIDNNDNIIFYTGYMHALKFRKFLIDCGYKPILSKGFFDSQPKKIERICTNLELENDLNQAFEAAHPAANKKDEQKDSQLCANSCKNSADKHCGRCKKVKYCSVSCQRQHWQHHKINCVLAKVSVNTAKDTQDK